MGMGVNSNAHRCALAALSRGDRGITASELSEITGISLANCCNAVTHILRRTKIYRASCVLKQKGRVKYRVLFVHEVIGDPPPGGEHSPIALIGTDANGNEYFFRSKRHAKQEGYNYCAINKRLIDGKPYAGLTWRLYDAAE